MENNEILKMKPLLRYGHGGHILDFNFDHNNDDEVVEWRIRLWSWVPENFTIAIYVVNFGGVLFLVLILVICVCFGSADCPLYSLNPYLYCKALAKRVSASSCFERRRQLSDNHHENYDSNQWDEGISTGGGQWHELSVPCCSAGSSRQHKHNWTGITEVIEAPPSPRDNKRVSASSCFERRRQLSDNHHENYDSNQWDEGISTGGGQWHELSVPCCSAGSSRQHKHNWTGITEVIEAPPSPRDNKRLGDRKYSSPQDIIIEMPVTPSTSQPSDQPFNYQVHSQTPVENQNVNIDNEVIKSQSVKIESSESDKTSDNVEKNKMPLEHQLIISDESRVVLHSGNKPCDQIETYESPESLSDDEFFIPVDVSSTDPDIICVHSSQTIKMEDV